MAHLQQLQFVANLARHLTASWKGLRVLEIGSADVNGSIRPFFSGSDYTGVDLAEGPGVDLVASGDALALPAESVDLAISCECFEHNPKWRETFSNMHRITRPGGIVAFTCASRGRLEHGTTRTRPDDSPGTIAIGWDYYRNLNRRDFERHFDLTKMFADYAFYRNELSCDLYFVGRKRGTGGAALALDLPRLWSELSSANTLVTPVEPPRLRRALGTVKDLPVKWAQYLPDPAYQEFVIRWRQAERAVRRVLRGK